METDHELSATKQYSNEEQYLCTPKTTDGSISQSSYLTQYNFVDFNSQKSRRDRNFSEVLCEKSDEPIDLTTIHNRNYPGGFVAEDSTAREFTSQYPINHVPASKPYECFPQSQGKHKFIYTDDNKILMVNVDNECVSPVSFSSEKQYEVIKAAKSLFSKRTRTLYHWMYPNVSRQRIKQAVASSWESLKKAEKEFYISQVLGRFGFSNSNLMINPQLDSIKQLTMTPLPDQSEIINKRVFERKRQSQTSATIPPANSRRHSGNFMGEFKAFNNRNKVRRGRREVQRQLLSNTPEFIDDPELSLELQKFSLKYNLSKN